MKILYATDDRHDALLAAGALRAVAPAASLTWAGRLPDAAEWLSSHREIDVIVVNAEVGNQCSAPFVRHARSLGLTAPILVVVPQARSLPAELIEAGPDEFVVKNQSLLPRLTTIVSRAIQREQAKRRLVEMAAENRRLREGEARAQKLDNRLTAALTLLQQRDADVESALGRLRTRETELVEAVQAQRVLEQRRAALQASLHDLELRSSDDRIAATRQAAEHQSAYEAALAARVAECDALDQELVVARETLSRAEKRHASELSDAAARFGERLEQELRRALDLHAAPLYNIVSYNVYERLLGLSLTPWSDRQNSIRLKNKEAGKTARTKAGAGRVAGTRPSHTLEDYVGEFEHPAYGVLTVSRNGESLNFDFHKIRMPLSHFHYDRFDTADDEEDGKWSVNFLTNPQGEVDKAEMSLDEAAVVFTRRVPAALTSAATLRQYVGTYETPSGGKFDVVIRPSGSLAVRNPDGTFQDLIAWRPNRFRIKEFADVVFEFQVDNGRATSLKQSDPAGEFVFKRK